MISYSYALEGETTWLFENNALAVFGVYSSWYGPIGTVSAIIIAVSYYHHECGPVRSTKSSYTQKLIKCFFIRLPFSFSGWQACSGKTLECVRTRRSLGCCNHSVYYRLHRPRHQLECAYIRCRLVSSVGRLCRYPDSHCSK